MADEINYLRQQAGGQQEQQAEARSLIERLAGIPKRILKDAFTASTMWTEAVRGYPDLVGMPDLIVERGTENYRPGPFHPQMILGGPAPSLSPSGPMASVGRGIKEALTPDDSNYLRQHAQRPFDLIPGGRR